MTTTYIVIISERMDQSTYYCDEKPEWVADDQDQVSLKFIPKNGLLTRVGKVNLVPRERVDAIVEDTRHG